MNAQKEAEYIAEIAKLESIISDGVTIENINRMLTLHFDKNQDADYSLTPKQVSTSRVDPLDPEMGSFREVTFRSAPCIVCTLTTQVD